MSHFDAVQDVYIKHFDRGPMLTDPPKAVVDSLLDAETGRIHFANVGGLLTLPPDDRHPPLVRETVELLHEVGTWCAGLASRAGAIAALPVADDRALQAGKLLNEIDSNTSRFGAAIKAKSAMMRSTVENLTAAMRSEEGGDLAPEVARRLADHFLSLGEGDRAAFVRRAEQAGNAAAIRAVANDALVPFVAPQLGRNALLDRAGRARHPGVAAMCDSYAQLAGRVDRNLARISETVAKAAAMAAQNTDAQKLALVRASMRAGRPSELAG